ncbi:MAG: porin family protein [Candidatus Azobacteroides sp.]|nr:porin family protein [Candidatus Azobacteroides sp.]
MKSHFLFVLIVALGFTSCAPRISTLMTKTYPPAPEDTPVEIFMDAHAVPPNSESLGLIKIADSGFTTQCDSITVVEHLKSEARKVGGNAVVVTEYIRPSIWRGSCHQMAGTILRVPDFNSAINVASSDSGQFVSVQVIKPERKLSRITLAANLGYGWRTARLNPDLEGFEKAYQKGLMSGWVYDASFNYYFNDNFGLGLLYSAYNASQNMYGQNLDTGVEGELKTNDLINFIGPVFLMRLPLANEKWTFDLGLGIGYLGYTSKLNFPDMRGKMYGSTVGIYYDLGVEYKLEKNWALGLHVVSMGGTLMNWTVEENGYKETINVKRPEDGEGLQQIQLLLGLRYYIK